MRPAQFAAVRKCGISKESSKTKIAVVALAFAAVVLLVNGCAGVVTATKQTGNPLGSFLLSSNAIDFGKVTVGKPSTQSISVTNSGSVALNITQVSLSNPQFSVSGLTTPMALPVGQSGSFTIGVNATAAGTVTGTLTVTGDSGSTPVVANLSATAVTAQPQLTLSQNPINFGSVTVGSKGNANLVLTNAGNADLTVSTMTVSGAAFTMSGITTPKTITAGQTATATVTFSPTTSGSASGSISIASNDSTNPTLTVSLSGTGTSAGSAQVSISPATFNFGSVVDGQTKSQVFTITNTGTAALTISQISASGSGYSVSGLATPTTIAVGATASFTAVFAPTTAGNLTGSVTLTSNGSNSPTSAALSGTGTASTLTLTANPTSLAFGSINAGTSSAKTVTITNTGTGSLTISQVTVSAKDFSASGISNGLALAAGQSATLNVSFSPTASENVTGNVTVATSQGATVVIPVTGSGLQPALTITPGSASFGSVTVGVSSTQAIQLSNSGTGTLTITQVSASGTGFSLTSLATLPINLGAGQTSNFNIQFLPAAAGAVTGSVTVTSNAPNSPAAIALSGTGVAQILTLSFTPTSLGFGNVNTGSSSSLPVTVKNTGNANVSITQISENGAGFTLNGASTPVTLTPNQTLTFNVIFNPTAAGADSGTVTVTSNASGSPTNIALSGTGVAAATHSASLSWTASTSTVSGYNVYRSTTSGTGYAKVNSSLVTTLNYVDSSVANGTTYYYVTTAVDGSGNESLYSNEATAVIP